MRIELHRIQKYFGSVHANDGVSLSIEEGTIHGLLGENGAGKTTLMKILSGYQSYDSGEIDVDGKQVRFGSPAESILAGIGMLHQDPLDVPAMSVLDNHMLGRRDGLFPKRSQARRELARLCSQFGFAIDPEAQVGSLTVGERQQLELVRLLSLGVRVIILDEPTTGISAPQKKLLFATLHQLAAQGLSVIFVSHKLDEVEELCSVATVLRLGRVSGAMRAPFDADGLVEMMFGQCLSRFPRVTVKLGEPVLELKDVAIHTYRLNVENISLRVRTGEVIGLAGLEGSGQRLLMETCAGIRHANRGRVFIHGQDMAHQAHKRFLDLGVSFVPAARLEEGMVGGLTIREHMGLGAGGDDFFVQWPKVDRITADRIEEYNIVGQPDTRVEELSGGNQQRALLAMLPSKLSLLVLEHPTRGLDIESTQWVWNLLLQRRKEGTAILYTSTDLDELVEHSDRIVVFSGGVMSRPISTSDITCDELGYLIGGRRQ